MPIRIASVLDAVLGPRQPLAHRTAYTAVRRILLPERSYACTVYIHEDTWGRRRWPWGRSTRLRAEVSHRGDPIPMAAWSSQQLEWGSPDVSHAENPEHAADIAVRETHVRVIRHRRGARTPVAVV